MPLSSGRTRHRGHRPLSRTIPAIVRVPPGRRRGDFRLGARGRGYLFGRHAGRGTAQGLRGRRLTSGRLGRTGRHHPRFVILVREHGDPCRNGSTAVAAGKRRLLARRRTAPERARHGSPTLRAEDDEVMGVAVSSRQNGRHPLRVAILGPRPENPEIVGRVLLQPQKAEAADLAAAAPGFSGQSPRMTNRW